MRLAAAVADVMATEVKVKEMQVTEAVADSVGEAGTAAAAAVAAAVVARGMAGGNSGKPSCRTGRCEPTGGGRQCRGSTSDW